MFSIKFIKLFLFKENFNLIFLDQIIKIYLRFNCER